MRTRRGSSDREKPAAPIKAPIVHVELHRAPPDRFGWPRISPTAHPSSPEFQAAYCAYFDGCPVEVDAPPMQAMAWRAAAIAGLLA